MTGVTNSPRESVTTHGGRTTARDDQEPCLLIDKFAGALGLVRPEVFPARDRTGLGAGRQYHGWQRNGTPISPACPGRTDLAALVPR